MASRPLSGRRARWVGAPLAPGSGQTGDGPMSAFTAVTLLLVVVGCASLAGTPRVAIRQPGAYATAPVDWWILVVIDPQPDDRLLIVEVDGQPGEYRRSDYTLVGERSARLRQVWFKALPEGCYWFFATVRNPTKAVASVISGPVSVIGADGPLCP